MPNMTRNILKALMRKNGDTPTSLSRKTTIGREIGVGQSTIHRFLNGDIREISPSKARILAEVYGVTESQLRGDMPIDKDFLDMETQVYHTTHPTKKDIIEKLMSIDREDDLSYIQQTINMIQAKKAGAIRVMNRRKIDIHRNDFNYLDRRRQDDRRHSPITMAH